jgi:hypothetical protein
MMVWWSITVDDSREERHGDVEFGHDKWRWWGWLMVARVFLVREPTVIGEHFEHWEKERDCGFPGGY